MKEYYVYFGNRFNAEEYKSFKEFLTKFNFSKKEKLPFFRVCKIGQTSNIKQRQQQLDVFVTDYVSLGECSKAKALFVESYLRLKIQKKFKNIGFPIKDDYFSCQTIQVLKSIQKHFREWVTEALALAENL